LHFRLHADEVFLATPIITDGTTDRVRDIPRVVLPSGADRFGERAQRLEALAHGHAMGDYLRLLAVVVRAQEAAFAARGAAEVAAAPLAASRDYGMPPLSAQGHARGAAWRADLADILASLRGRVVNGPAAAVAAVAALPAPDLEALADRILAGTTLDSDAPAVPFVGAALQVYFARLAASLDAADVARCDVATICPVCASRPAASVVRIGADRQNLRYLACALCSTEWHLTRVKCSSCEAEKGLKYLSIETAGRGPERSVARAEACDECKTYLKIFYQEHDAQVEPLADDLATLALDLLVDADGYARSGPNLLLHPGSG
jgi:FdhE protein